MPAISIRPDNRGSPIQSSAGPPSGSSPSPEAIWPATEMGLVQHGSDPRVRGAFMPIEAVGFDPQPSDPKTGTLGNKEAPRLPFPPVVLGITGCSGSGKTTLANELARTLRGLRFHLDDYYLDLSDLPLDERVKKNFDDPALI